MAEIDLFKAEGEAGFDEGWVEGSAGIVGGITGGLHARICHGIDLGIDIGAAAEAEGRLRLLVLGARANVGVMARAGVRGQVTLDPNIFERFGLTARLEAAAEAAARARLEISLEAEYVADLAAQQLNGLALELFLAFLREIRVGGGVMGKIAYSAMARGHIQVAGSFKEDEGFTIGGGYSVGLKGGTGMDYFINLGFDNPRRFFGTAVDLIVNEITSGLRDELPAGSDFAIEIFRFITPAALFAAYEVGQTSLASGITDSQKLVRTFMQVMAEELQRYLIDKAAEFSSQMVAGLAEEALLRLAGRELTGEEKQSLEDASQQLIATLQDGRIQAEDLDEVILFSTTLAQLVSPQMVQRYRRPLAILWTAVTAGVALRDVGQLMVSGEISIGVVGAGGRAFIREMPPVASMPSVVVQEYMLEVADFDGTQLTFDHAVDYLVNIGIGPIMSEQAPEISVLLDQLHRTTGISPGNIITFGLQGAIGGSLNQTELYQELTEFVRHCVDEVVRTYVFEAFDRASGDNDDARLYMDEVARPAVELLVSFLFEQLDRSLASPSLIGSAEYLANLQGGLSALLYKIVARNLVVLEQIAADKVREQAVHAFSILEQEVRSDQSTVLMQTSLEHIDEVLAQLSRYVPVVPTETGLTEAQVAAIQTFIAEMLSMAQEFFSHEIFTDSRWDRRRQALLALLLSLDKDFDWSSRDLIQEAVDTIQSCLFVPDEQAIEDIYNINLEVLSDQLAVALRRVPPALNSLILALMAPQLEEMSDLAEQSAQFFNSLLNAAEATLEALQEAIEEAGELAAAAADAVVTAIDNAVNGLSSLGSEAIRTALVATGKNNLRALGAPDNVVDGFGAVLAGIAGLISPLIDAVLEQIRTADFIQQALDEAVTGFTPAELLMAQSVQGLQPQASNAFGTTFRQKVKDLFIPTDGSDPNPLFTVETFGFKALSPSDFAATTAQQVLSLLSANSLLSPRLKQAIQEAVKASKLAQKASKETQRQNAIANYQAVKGREGTSLEIYSPAPLEDRVDRIFAYGPQVPLSIRIHKAGQSWASNDQGRRIQISCNGHALSLSASEWSYNDARSQILITATLRLDAGQVIPGLNVLEISVANTESSRLRHTVNFLVDPDGPPPMEELVIDGEQSRFNAPGNDHRSAYEEFVLLRWEGTSALDLSGWKFRDLARHEYTFGTLNMAPGQVLRLRTGGSADEDSQTDVHWGRKSAVWNNEGDTVLLIDSKGLIRSQYTYGNRQQ